MKKKVKDASYCTLSDNQPSVDSTRVSPSHLEGSTSNDVFTPSNYRFEDYSCLSPSILCL